MMRGGVLIAPWGENSSDPGMCNIAANRTGGARNYSGFEEVGGSSVGIFG